MHDPADISATEIFEAGKAAALREAQGLIYAYCQRQIDVAHSQGVHWMPTHPLAAHHRANVAQQVFQFLNLFDKKQEALGHESPWRRMSNEVSRPPIYPDQRPAPTEAEIHQLQRYGNFHHTAEKLYGKDPRVMKREIADLLPRVEAYEKALDLAIAILGRWEPSDSRAISDQFVTIAAVRCGDKSKEILEYLDRYIDEVAAMPPPEPADVKIESLSEWTPWKGESGPPWSLPSGARVDILTAGGNIHEDLPMSVLDWSIVASYCVRERLN